MTETWFGNLRKSISWEPERPVLGIMSFEVARLMSKVINIWQCLTDTQIVRLREEVVNSVGIQKLVSENEEYLMDLVLAEIIENLESVAKSVAVLGKKCAHPTYQNLQNVFDDPGVIDPKWYRWQYRLKKMEKRVKKMGKFVAATEQLYSELEVLAELEQPLRRMRAGANLCRVRLLEFQQKVVWQRQEVKNLQEMSPWIRTFDYIIRLLLRSLFTIIERIKYVYGVNQTKPVEVNNNDSHILGDSLDCRNSVTYHLKTSVYTFENDDFSAQVGRAFSNLSSADDRGKSKNRKSLDHSPSFILCQRPSLMKVRRFAPIVLTGCVTGGIESPFVDIHTSSCGSSNRSNGAWNKDTDEIKDTCTIPDVCGDLAPPKASFFHSKRRLLIAPPSTLGYAGLALHYANVIIVIEKLASAPHLISLEARNDLYSMLPSSVRSSLRAKLKAFSRNQVSPVYDAAFAAEWGLTIARILDWLSPLAHNMVRWQSERNFEKRRLVYGSNVLLVQTLQFADQVETEGTIVELLMGLNYLSQFSRDVNEQPFQEYPSSRACDNHHLFTRYNNLID